MTEFNWYCDLDNMKQNMQASSSHWGIVKLYELMNIGKGDSL